MQRPALTKERLEKEGIVPGAYIWAYEKGIHIVLDIKDRPFNRDNAKEWMIEAHDRYYSTPDICNALITYRRVLSQNYKPSKGSSKTCDAAYVSLVSDKDLDLLRQDILILEEYILANKELLNGK